MFAADPDFSHIVREWQRERLEDAALRRLARQAARTAPHRVTLRHRLAAALYRLAAVLDDRQSAASLAGHAAPPETLLQW